MHAGLLCIRLSHGLNIKVVDVFKLVGAGLKSCMLIGNESSAGDLLLLRDSSGVFSHPRDSGCHNTLFLSCPYLRLIIGLIRDLFVFYVDPLVDLKTFQTTAEAKGEVLNPVKHVKARPTRPIIYYRPFQGGTSVVVPQCYMFCLMYMVFSNMVN